MSRDRRSGREFYSGRLSERDMLGEFKGGDDYRKAYLNAANEDGFMIRHQAIELIRKFSESDPRNPSKPFAKELRMAVIEELGLEESEDMDRVKFFSAVGTPLDHFHGVDAWVEFDSGRGGPRMVTLDVTLNTEKETHKADIIVQKVPDPSENEDEFLKLVYEIYAPQIAEQLKTAVNAMMRRRGRAQEQEEKRLAS
jgi:hypothetical protein